MMPYVCRATMTQQSYDQTERARSATPWGYAAVGAVMASFAGSHVAHAEAEVHFSRCFALFPCELLCVPACCGDLLTSRIDVVPQQVKAHVTISDSYNQPTDLKGNPRDIIVYQYEVCPFCCKLKAFLDYHKVSLSSCLGTGTMHPRHHPISVCIISQV